MLSSPERADRLLARRDHSGSLVSLVADSAARAQYDLRDGRLAECGVVVGLPGQRVRNVDGGTVEEADELHEFEDLILQLFQAIPEFDEVRKTRSRGDGGIDVVAVNKKEFTGGRVAIQAKCYAPGHKVPVAEVREMIGSISQREFHKGIIITTSSYTSAARDEAARLGIELYEGERLLWLLRHHLRREYTIIDIDRRRAPIRNLPKASRQS